MPADDGDKPADSESRGFFLHFARVAGAAFGTLAAPAQEAVDVHFSQPFFLRHAQQMNQVVDRAMRTEKADNAQKMQCSAVPLGASHRPEKSFILIVRAVVNGLLDTHAVRRQNTP